MITTGRCSRAFVAGLIAVAVPSAALAQATSDRWTFSLTPYLWLPTIDGSLNYSVPAGAVGSPQVDLNANDYLKDLSLALMLAGEARKDRWSIFTDVIYLDFSGQDSAVKGINFGGPLVSTTLNASTSSSLKGLLWTLGGGYTAVQAPQGNLDVFGGLRYFGLKATTDWQLTATVTGPLGGGQVFPRTGNISEKENLWDGIVGVKGQLKLGASNWFVPYYVDVGTGSSTVTWQGLVGIAYSFKWGDALLAYRYLYYDQDTDKLLQNVSFGGLALGVTFRF